jgi:3-methylfumaryl-CoA hydratase
VTLDIDALRAWIGRTETAADVVTPRLVAELNVTLDRPGGDPALGEPAPLAVHWCLAPPKVPMHALGPDGHPARGGFLPPVPLPRRMWAGGRLELVDAVRVGDAVERRSRIADVSVKEGRSGTLCFVTVAHEILTPRGLAVRERQDIVYRDAAPAAAGNTVPPPEPPPEPDPTWRERVETSPALLFRYSAVTFNGHRIHYDHRYCVEEEGYPGLVVHGPLQATLLVEFAAGILGGPPPTFSFRSVRPVFVGAPITLAARAAGDGLALAVVDHAGHACMLAEAG